ncbi:hypothetical protein GDO81_009772 [Engystomops pustulosus]|uniref:Uncharacterized protein n=1 Tax=Engystomops pustulosus TaxID=76066 RepID=A0AAV7BTQ5_ENGPU|nr:hypothetical protein GDO81_009772 [Engystomops pustulosus]
MEKPKRGGRKRSCSTRCTPSNCERFSIGKGVKFKTDSGAISTLWDCRGSSLSHRRPISKNLLWINQYMRRALLLTLSNSETEHLTYPCAKKISGRCCCAFLHIIWNIPLGHTTPTKEIHIL